MITKNPMQLKAFVKKEAAKRNISAQLVLQNYMLERLLERISLSPYKENFVVKGGFLIAAIVGLDARTTMDLDTTIKGLPLTKERTLKAFEEICKIPVEDEVRFEMIGVTDIREKDDYPGIRLALIASYSPIRVPLTVDITTGDLITPREIHYDLPLLFDHRSINVLAYNLETILAEKLETILSRGVANTRLRDYYDLFILCSLHKNEYSEETLAMALERTARKRGSLGVLTHYPKIVEEIRSSGNLRALWEKYRQDYEYARHISFDETCDVIQAILESISPIRSK